jgi:lysophospholipase L1-like esterase
MVLTAAIAGMGTLVVLLHRGRLMASPQAQVYTIEAQPAAAPTSMGTRIQLSYEQWVAVMGREAKIAAEEHPKHLDILAGDSLSLWFPQELLPSDRRWLNQGISGETSYGLLKRVKLLDQTQPQNIFVLVGINDLIRGVSEETLLANQQEIIRHLKRTHPQARIVVQSILPHGGKHIAQQYERTSSGKPRAIWVDRLGSLPNAHIRELNQRLAKIAELEGVKYLDLHPYFVDSQGDLAEDLSTDGLHLSPAGYQIWRSRLDAFFAADGIAVKTPPLPQKVAKETSKKP